ncbi:MAG: rhodanese-related sulfurtransferase [Crocinitomix sp.]|jgi:rhodanese-related sulfurtransferase
MKTAFIGVLISVFALTACAQSDATNDQTETTTVEASKEVKRVTKSEFKTFLAEHENVQLIDVRTADEFQAGAIDAASNIDYNDPKFEANINTLDKDVPVLIYCRSGGRSAKALKIFEENGFTHVLELEGGYLNW